MKDSELIVNSHPKSMFSEAIKTIRMNLQFTEFEKVNKVILVTSPEPGDGKSFISANLAIAFAQENKKVLIIDADLRCGRQQKLFKVANPERKGYTGLIINPDANKSSFIFKTNIDNVDLLCNGITPPNPTELLASNNNKKLLDELKEVYDIIILDCAPALGLNDGLVMTKYSDVNLVVITANDTKFETLEETKKSFTNINKKIHGVIMNKAKIKKSSYNGYYYYDKYYKEG